MVVLTLRVRYKKCVQTKYADLSCITVDKSSDTLSASRSEIICKNEEKLVIEFVLYNCPIDDCFILFSI